VDGRGEWEEEGDGPHGHVSTVWEERKNFRGILLPVRLTFNSLLLPVFPENENEGGYERGAEKRRECFWNQTLAERYLLDHGGEDAACSKQGTNWIK